MRIIKLKIFPVPVRLHSGNGKYIFVSISPIFAKCKNVAHSLKPGETPRNLATHQGPNDVLKYRKYDEIETKNQITATAT